MPIITLPDGSSRHYDQAVTPLALAADIGPGLARATVAAEVDGSLADATRPIERDATLRLITAKDADALEVIRHSTAHLLAQAVKRLFPEAQVTIGPVIKDGFYYDFSFHRPFTTDDLAAIEAEMKKIAKENLEVERTVMPRDDAVKFFREIGEEYKAKIIASIPANEEISLYRQGAFIDLCRGPHVPSTGRLGIFKLTKVAGAYWRGDVRNEMLQRIYGTAWADKKDLADYLHRIEEAERRDHRRLGRELDLFHLQDVAVGSVFWHPKGWTLYRRIERYLREKLESSGYVEVKSPQLVSRSLWEDSGHWEKFRANMFTVQAQEEKLDLAIKPMNCPCHVQIYRVGLKSYRDLPLRMAEFGSCHRYEPSGALHGLMRVRAFTQDDAHIFCTEDQITAETKSFCELLLEVYRDFGFTDVAVKFSDRPAVRAGEDAIWDKAEKSLQLAANAAGLEAELNPGEGAFYGPKLEFVLRDAIGRDWQCGTLQVAFVLPERLDASYIAQDGSKQRPVMLHRAIFGSFERFIGILIEHYAGSLPLWLSPIQAVVATITDRQDAYAREVEDFLKKQDLRVESDLRNEKIGFKIREHTIKRIPYLLVVGDRETETQEVAVRTRSGKDFGSMPLKALAERLVSEDASCGRHHLED